MKIISLICAVAVLVPSEASSKPKGSRESSKTGAEATAGFICPEPAEKFDEWIAILDDPSDVCHDVVVKKRDGVCTTTRVEGAVVFSKLHALCLYRCTGWEALCGGVGGTMTSTIEKFLVSKTPLEPPINKNSKNFAWLFFTNLWPLMLALCAYLMALGGYENAPVSMLLIFVSWIVGMFENGMMTLSMLNTVLILVSGIAATQKNKIALFNLGVIEISLFCVAFSFLFVGIYLHMLIVFVVLFCLTICLFKAFTERNETLTINLLVAGVSIPVLTELVAKIVLATGGSFGASCILGIMVAFFPAGGNWFLIGNLQIYGLSAVTYLGSNQMKQPMQVLIFMIVCLFLFVMFRSLIGYCKAKRMNHQFESTDFGECFCFYCADIFGSVIWLMKNFTQARLAEVLLHSFCVIILWYEITCALDFFLLRCCFYAFYLGNSDYRIYELAHARLDLSRSKKKLASFPTEGSGFWTDAYTAGLEEMAKYLVKFYRGGKYVGSGILRRTAEGVRAYSVKHVLDASDSFYHGKTRFTLGNARKEGADHSGDYVASVEASGSDGLSMRDFKYSDLGLLSGGIFISDNGTSFPCVAPRARIEFDARTEIIHSIVDLKSGDSGAPVFGELKNGEFVYMGNVANGTSYSVPNQAYSVSYDNEVPAFSKQPVVKPRSEEIIHFNNSRNLAQTKLELASSLDELTEGKYYFTDHSMEDCVYEFSNFEEYEQFLADWFERFDSKGNFRADSKTQKERDKKWRKQQRQKYRSYDFAAVAKCAVALLGPEGGKIYLNKLMEPGECVRFEGKYDVQLGEGITVVSDPDETDNHDEVGHSDATVVTSHE